MGVNCLLEMSWKTSEPQLSQEYALTSNSGLTSDTRVTMPRTLIKRPRCSAWTLRTGSGSLRFFPSSSYWGNGSR